MAHVDTSLYIYITIVIPAPYPCWRFKKNDNVATTKLAPPSCAGCYGKPGSTFGARNSKVSPFLFYDCTKKGSGRKRALVVYMYGLTHTYTYGTLEHVQLSQDRLKPHRFLIFDMFFFFHSYLGRLNEIEVNICRMVKSTNQHTMNNFGT